VVVSTTIKQQGFQRPVAKVEDSANQNYMVSTVILMLNSAVKAGAVVGQYRCPGGAFGAVKVGKFVGPTFGKAVGKLLLVGG
jgi:hypothetical protein